MRAFFLSIFTLATAALFAQDITPPTAACKDITLQLDSWGYAAITAEELDNGSTDDEGIATYEASQTEFFCEHLAVYENRGPISVLLTVTDAAGNSSSCESLVTVEDNIAPINPTCVDFVADIQEDGTYYIYPFFFDGGSEEGCLADIQADRTDFTCEDIGEDIIVNVTYIDLSGNSTVCQAVVTVIDINPPTPVCQDITVQLGSNGEANIEGIDIDGGSYDNCTIDTYTASQSTFDESNLGANSVILTVTDLYGNSSECEATVTVEDYIPEIAAVCQDVTVSLAGGAAAISVEDIDAGSSGYTTMELSNDYFDCTNIGDNEVTLTVSDDNGGTSNCTALVTVIGQIPSISISVSEIPAGCQGNFQVFTANSDEFVNYLWNDGSTTSTINATSGLYAVLVTNEYGCTAEAHETAIFDPTGGQASFTIIGLDEVKLKRNTVYNGGVGVRKSGAKAVLERNSVVTSSTTFVKAPIIEVKSGSEVTNTYIGSTDIALPTALRNPFSSSKFNVKVPDNASVTLTDSIYGVIEIGKNATVEFTEPRIYAVSYWAKENSTVNFRNCTDVIAHKFFKLDKNSKTNTEQKTVIFQVEGNSPSDEFTFGAGVEFYGKAYAPKGDIVALKATSAKPSSLTGQFIAKKVDADEYVNWNWNTNCDQTCNIGSKFTETPSNARKAQTEEVQAEKAIEPANPVSVTAFPNPFTDVTTIRFIAGTNGKARLSIFNISGQLVESLYEGNVEAGSEYTFQFNGTNQPAGAYFYRLETEDNVYVNKILLTK
jgi:hypothetical protein